MMTDKDNQPKFSDLDKWDDLFDEHLGDDVNVKRALTNLYNGLQRRGIPKSEETKAKIAITKTGIPLPEETKAKMSAAHMGVPKPRSAEHTSNLSAALKGRKSPNKDKPMAAETKAKISLTKTGVQQSKETTAKIAAANTGKKRSEEARANMRAAAKGRPSHFKGKLRPKVTCPHCGKEGGANLMKRYHFDNCKLKRD